MAAFDQAEPLFRKVRSDLGLANTLRSRGDLLRQMKKYDLALQCYDQAESLYRKEQEPMGLGYTLAEKYRCLRGFRHRRKKSQIRAELLQLLPTLSPPAQKYIMRILDRS